MIDDELYDVSTLAKRLKCNPVTVYQMLHDKRIPCVRVGNRFRITKSAVDAFLRGGGIDGDPGKSALQKQAA
jgi:excisionase family DNA binding protein